MNNDLFTAIPDTKNSDELNLTAKKIICDKLSSILGQIATQLKTDLTHEIGALRATSSGLPNPALFHYYFKLKDSIAKGNLDDILDTISLIANESPSVKRSNPNYPDVLSAINSEWEKNLLSDSVRKDSISEFGMENKFELVRPLFNEQLIHQTTYIITALNILKEVDPTHYYSAIDKLIAIKVFEGTVRGFSFQAAYGNIYIRIPEDKTTSVAYYLEHIVHECAHQHLFALQLLDPVVLNDKTQLFNAPIRKQQRPMDGIFHACFVLARMVRCFSKTHDHLGSDYNSDFLGRINGWFEHSYNTVKEHAILSEKGKRIFNSFRDCAYD